MYDSYFCKNLNLAQVGAYSCHFLHSFIFFLPLVTGLRGHCTTIIAKEWPLGVRDRN